MNLTIKTADITSGAQKPSSPSDTAKHAVIDRGIDRLVTFRTAQGTPVRGSLQNLSRRRIVVEIYDPALLLRTSEVLNTLEIRRGGQAAYRGEAIVTGVVSTGVALLVSATLTAPWVGRLADRNLSAEAQAFATDWLRTTRLHEGYRLRVAELRSYLTDLKYWLDQIDLDSDQEIGVASLGLPEDEYETLKGAIAPVMTDVYMNLEFECRSIAVEEASEHKAFAQSELVGLMMPSPFYNRIYTKPLGYAGDYQMVNMMYDNARAGASTYAQILNYVCLCAGPAQAHRNRIEMLRSFLADCYATRTDISRPLSILNVGCGPAQELNVFLADRPDAELDLHLVDFDAGTLTYARDNIQGALAEHGGHGSRLETTLKSVQELLRQAVEAKSPAKTYDVIYCAGLFDYLSDRVCSKLVNLFYKWCSPGGRVLVTNVHDKNPVRGFMEHVMEWHLILRNKEQVAGLAPPNTNAKVYGDRTGINVFLEITKPLSVNG